MYGNDKTVLIADSAGLIGSEAVVCKAFNGKFSLQPAKFSGHRRVFDSL